MMHACKAVAHCYGKIAVLQMETGCRQMVPGVIMIGAQVGKEMLAVITNSLFPTVVKTGTG